jgi:PAS domain-containing protein
MSGSFKRRRRRTGSTSARYHPSQLVPIESVRPGRMGKVELAACGAVAIVAFALIALIWLLTQRAVQDQQVEVRERAEHALSAQAATIAETIGHELLMIDQSLTVLQAAWKADSDSVDLAKWQATMPALTAVTDDLFIADEQHVIRQDILPKAVGQGVGSAYVTFPHGSLEQFQSDGTKNKDSLILQGDAGEPIDARQFLMYIVRPLDHPAGWMIGASYRSEEMTRLFAKAALGYNSVIALTDTKRGVVQSVVGPAARRPKIDISQSALFAAISRTPSGLWLGDTPIDGTQRMHAFQHVTDRDMSVVVAANWSEVMAVANNLAAGAHALAIVGTGLVLLIGGLVLWELYTFRSNKRQKRVFERTRSEMERLRGEENVITARAQLNAIRLKLVMDSTSDGIALFDSNLRLLQWNHPFLRGIGVELKQDMPLDGLLRAQGHAGLLDPVSDIEAEISRRVAVLQSGDPAGASQPGPDHKTLILRGLPITEGGFMLLLNGLETWAPAPAPAPASPEIDEPAAPETVPSGPIEW